MFARIALTCAEARSVSSTTLAERAPAEVSNAMNIIFILLLTLIPAAFPFEKLPTQTAQSKENLSVPIKDLQKAPTEVVLDDRALTLSAYLWRDFMPSTLPAPNGSPMMAVFKVATSDKKPFPSKVRIDRAWVIFGEQVWANEFPAKVYPSDSYSWNCPESPVCEVSARNGPKWGPGVFVDVCCSAHRQGRAAPFASSPKAVCSANRLSGVQASPPMAQPLLAYKPT
jgi:hypothetical protein